MSGPITRKDASVKMLIEVRWAVSYHTVVRDSLDSIELSYYSYESTLL